MAKELWLWVLEGLGKLLAGLKNMLRKGGGHLRLFLSGVPRSVWKRTAIALPALFALYILIGVFFVHRIDDRFDLDAETPSGGSAAVTIAADLINRETRLHNWMVNDPAFLPGWWIDNAPNFQRGIMGAVSRFSIEARDRLGRTRGSSAVDADLELAAGNLSREMDRWIYDLSISMLPTTPSDTYFRQGADNLAAYNARLADGNAVYDRRADNLMATLDRIALDLGASSAALDDFIREEAGSFGFSSSSDDLFYQVKGQVYAYTYLLMGLQTDFARVIAEKDLTPLFQQMLQSLKAASSLDPAMVMNGSIDGIAANHLSVMGFYLLRSRTQLREITSILLT